MIKILIILMSLMHPITSQDISEFPIGEEVFYKCIHSADIFNLDIIDDVTLYEMKNYHLLIVGVGNGNEYSFIINDYHIATYFDGDFVKCTQYKTKIR